MKRPRRIMFLGVFAGVALVIVLLGALLLPRLINSQRIKDHISSELAKKTEGSFIFEKIALLWLPRPAVVIEHAEFFFDDTVHGAVRNTKIYPSIFYLLMGRVVVYRALLQGVKITLRFVDSPKKPVDLGELEKQIRLALAGLIAESPAPRIDVSDATVEIKIGDKPPVLIEDASLQTAGSRSAQRFQLSARSNLFERLRIEGRISPESLASQLEVRIQRLHIKDSLPFLSRPISEYVQQGEASLDVKIAAVGLRKVKASVGGSIGPLLLVRHAGAATVEAKRLQVEVAYEGGAVQVQVDRLELGAPRLKASGELRIESGSVSTRVDVRHVDIGEVGYLLREIAADKENIKKMLRYLPAGTVSELRVQSAGRSFAELALSENVTLSGLVRDCKILIPASDLELKNVTGSVRIANGILEADDVSANLGTMKGWTGKLRLGVDGRPAPFHLDIRVQAAAPELQTVLLKVVRNETFHKELLNLQNVEGELSGRLILGETLDAIAPVVKISEAVISATYAPLPFPIAIRGGRFSYEQGLLTVENAQGSMGRSTFGGLGLALHRDGSRQIKVDSRRISLDLQEADTLLRRFRDLQSHYEKLQSARGRIELERLTLAGAYDDPRGWTFESAGAFDQIEIMHADFPGSITLARGKFDATEKRIVLSNTATELVDASFVFGGTFEYKKGSPFQFETSGTGTIGAQMIQWLSRRVELPEELKLRSPLRIVAERLAWRAAGDIAFRGQVTAAGGPKLSLEAVKSPQGLAVRHLTIDDVDGHARVTFQLAKDRFDLSFSGELTQQTIDKIFVSFITQDGALSGDVQISGSLRRPTSVSLQGQLDGENLRLRLGTEEALVATFSIEAGGGRLLVRSADLRWGQSRFAVAGKVTGGEEILRVEVDVTADQLDWSQLRGVFGRKGAELEQQSNEAWAFPGVEGRLRLKTNRFTFDRFNVTSLETTVAISRSGFKAEIHRGMACGINVTGRVDVVGNEIGLDVQLAARSAQLEPTTVCLTNRQNDVTGTYSLTARFSARGERDQLVRALQGTFELSAQDGEFIRSPGIDATFDYLNRTGDFKVAFPDLERQTFPYRLVTLKGRLEGEILVGDEIVVHSPRLNLSGYGRVDLKEKRIEGKGLVSVLQPVDEVVSRTPVISSLWGGSLVGIPVRVTGSLEHPDVTYLSPADLGVELLNIPLKLLGMPMGAMRLFTPGRD